MKLILLAAILALTLACGCEPETTPPPPAKEQLTDGHLIGYANGHGIGVFTYKGHDYAIFSGSMLHLQSCPCITNHVVVESPAK